MMHTSIRKLFPLSILAIVFFQGCMKAERISIDTNTPGGLAFLFFVGGNPYTIKGSVSNLGSGKSLTITNNGSDAVTITSNGSYSFPGTVSNGAAYDVAVSARPDGQSCSIENRKGIVSGDVTANIVCHDSGTVETTVVVEENIDGYIITDMAAQSNGKIIIAGGQLASGGPNQRIYRLNSNAQKDSSFGANGKRELLSTSFPDSPACPSGGNIFTNAAAVAPSNDAIVIGGTRNSCYTLARLDASGNVDTTFGHSGYLREKPSAMSSAYLSDLEITNNDEIFLAGTANSSPYVYAMAGKWSAPGSSVLYYSSGTAGFSNDNGNSISLQSDGRVILGGGNSTDGRFYALKNDLSGLDTTFGTGGMTTFIDTGGIADTFIQSNGKIVAMLPSSSAPPFFYRVQADGASLLDSTFSVNGQLDIGEWADGISFQYPVPGPSGLNSVGYRSGNVVQQNDGKIVFAVGYTNYSFHRIRITRRNVDGSADTTFNGTGHVDLDNSSLCAAIDGYNFEETSKTHMALDGNGGIFVGYACYNGTTAKHQWVVLKAWE